MSRYSHKCSQRAPPLAEPLTDMTTLGWPAAEHKLIAPDPQRMRAMMMAPAAPVRGTCSAQPVAAPILPETTTAPNPPSMATTTDPAPLAGASTRPPNLRNDDNHNMPPSDSVDRINQMHLAPHSAYPPPCATRDQTLLRKDQTHMSWPTLTYTHMPCCSGLRLVSPGGSGVHATTCRNARGVYLPTRSHSEFSSLSDLVHLMKLQVPMGNTRLFHCHALPACNVCPGLAPLQCLL